MRRLHSVGSGAPFNFGRRRRRAAGLKQSAAAAWPGRAKNLSLKIRKKIRSILNIF